MSPTGQCRTFSADADGYVRADGAGVVALATLAEARAQGYPILALIRGSAVDQDGKSQGLTAPNGPAQRAVIQEALRRARGSREYRLSGVPRHRDPAERPHRGPSGRRGAGRRSVT